MGYHPPARKEGPEFMKIRITGLAHRLGSTIIAAESQLEDCRGRSVFGNNRLHNIVNECSQTDVTGVVFRE